MKIIQTLTLIRQHFNNCYSKRFCSVPEKEKPFLPVEVVKLNCPNIDEVAEVLRCGLPEYFNCVQVDVSDCPDLSCYPFNFAARGLGGSTALLDIGGRGNLMPLYDKTKVYSMCDIAALIGLKPCFILGAGAGPWPFHKKNCEMIANILIEECNVVQKTYTARLDFNDNIILETLPANEMRFAIMAHLFVSEGLPSKVLEIKCKQRRQNENFISSIRLALQKCYPNKTLGLGGTFIMRQGVAKHHVMPDFAKRPILSEAELERWFQYFEFSAPFISVGTFLTKNIPRMDLRIQHFHSFSDFGVGGHYHHDITSQSADYLGFFNLGQTLFRIDQPIKKKVEC